MSKDLKTFSEEVAAVAASWEEHVKQLKERRHQCSHCGAEAGRSKQIYVCQGCDGFACGSPMCVGTKCAKCASVSCQHEQCMECWKRYCGQPSCTWLAYVTMKKQVAAAAPVGNKRNRTEWEQDMKVCQFCFATGKYIFAEYEPPSPRSPCFPEFDGES